MSNYDDSNKGAIWKNDKKETERHPDFKGSVNVDGKEYWVAAWKRDPNGNPKAPALRFALTAKDEQGGQSQTGADQSQTNSRQESGSGGGMSDFEDDIPFMRLGPEYFV